MPTTYVHVCAPIYTYRDICVIYIYAYIYIYMQCKKRTNKIKRRSTKVQPVYSGLLAGLAEAAAWKNRWTSVCSHGTCPHTAHVALTDIPHSEGPFGVNHKLGRPRTSKRIPWGFRVVSSLTRSTASWFVSTQRLHVVPFWACPICA